MTQPESSAKPDAERSNVRKAASPEPSPALSFDVLAQGSKEVLIEHFGQIYRLRATRNGGLILNK